ncbi:MAG: tRNA 2-selenouridine(34) synthase MnmH [Bacteroidetes bacterium]|nr:tRNA 2-selenouridine(34) synthase MnmH [Bacteroidota bacterium]
MPITKLNIEEFLATTQNKIIFDVRSPGEYEHAHIPGALSLPLFTNEERKIVGTAYKQESREKAIKIGLDFFGSKTVKIIEEVEKISSAKNNIKEFGVHCWRGGMRSAAIAWLLDLYGFKVYLLSGGYKAYRNYAIQQFTKNYTIQILGGYTGSNKTGIINELKKEGEKVIDLESLAGHKGSAFGNLDMHSQPSQEMFENLLATELNKYQSALIWMEDEGQRLGNVNIPFAFFEIMRQQPVLFINISFEERLLHIVNGYGKYSKEKLINAIIRIKKKLGGLETKNAVNFLLEDDLKNCFAILLKYYDKLYLRSTYNRENADNKIKEVDLSSTDAKLNTQKILKNVYNK